ncbi:MAG: serine/threonine protein phosphatase [Gammaproteobacteria bacterium]|nr:serine/threonine protein phosphatase [Gammaproteobacteria bacterium]
MAEETTKMLDELKAAYYYCYGINGYDLDIEKARSCFAAVDKDSLDNEFIEIVGSDISLNAIHMYELLDQELLPKIASCTIEDLPNAASAILHLTDKIQKLKNNGCLLLDFLRAHNDWYANKWCEESGNLKEVPLPETYNELRLHTANAYAENKGMVFSGPGLQEDRSAMGDAAKTRFVFLRPGFTDNLKVVGDLHGDTIASWAFELLPDDRNAIYLGDYVDRGKDSLGTLLRVLIRQKLAPEKVLLLRGNHETMSMSLRNMYDEFESTLPKELSEDAKEELLEKLVKELRRLYTLMPIWAAQKQWFFVHAAPPLNGKYFQNGEKEASVDLSGSPQRFADEDVLTQCLWGDFNNAPAAAPNIFNSDRGVGWYYNSDALSLPEPLGRIKLVRGHQVVKPDKIQFFNGQGWSLFGSSGNDITGDKKTCVFNEYQAHKVLAFNGEQEAIESLPTHHATLLYVLHRITQLFGKENLQLADSVSGVGFVFMNIANENKRAIEGWIWYLQKIFNNVNIIRSVDCVVFMGLPACIFKQFQEPANLTALDRALFLSKGAAVLPITFIGNILVRQVYDICEKYGVEYCAPKDFPSDALLEALRKDYCLQVVVDAAEDPLFTLSDHVWIVVRKSIKLDEVDQYLQDVWRQRVDAVSVIENSPSHEVCGSDCLVS